VRVRPKSAARHSLVTDDLEDKRREQEEKEENKNERKTKS
jgi:hypothetical protein